MAFIVNTEQAKHNMITQQIRSWGTYDNDILTLINSIARESFVPEAYKKLAYADIAIPLGDGQVMLSPKEIGRLLSALQILPTETVLEIGTGSGYLTTLLSKQANHVYSIEINPERAHSAAQILQAQSLENVTLLTGDGLTGCPQHAPYDIIICTGSMLSLPFIFKEVVNIGGRIFIILGEAPKMEATVLTKQPNGSWKSVALYETSSPRLLNAKETQHFVF